MVFPALTNTFTTGTGVAQEMNCTQEFTHNATTPTEISYANNANYQIIPFSSDFRYSDAPTGTLNWNSRPRERSGLLAGRPRSARTAATRINVVECSHVLDRRGRQRHVSANRTPPPIAAAGARPPTNSDHAGPSIPTNTAAVRITHGARPT